jgi:hypothetical protein
MLRAEEPWLPLNGEELALKDNPKHPGADAMILYREFEQNDKARYIKEYIRIKVFTEQGERYAGIETMPYDRGSFHVTEIRGRTIHRDGRIIPFTGKPLERVTFKQRSFREMVTAFTLPEVAPGSILEYTYTLHCDWFFYPINRWDIEQSLYQRKVHFSYIPDMDQKLAWAGALLPPGVEPVQTGKGYVLDMQDVPPFEMEDYMPPEQEARPWVIFFYSAASGHSQYVRDEYWTAMFVDWSNRLRQYMDQPGAMRKAVEKMIGPSDPSEAKLRKIYERVQALKNFTYETEDPGGEARPGGQKIDTNVGEVLKHGYSWHDNLNRTFVALARAAGFDATVVAVTQRNRGVFHPDVLSFDQFGSELALVRDGGKDLYLDPGTLFCPFGLLPWEDTGTTGARWDPKSVSLARTPLPEPENASILREGKFTLQADGALDGAVQATFSGQEALNLRLEERNQDAADRKRRMEELAQSWFPVSGAVEMQSVNEWRSSTLPLVVTYKVHLPAYIPAAGNRLLLPGLVFAAAYRNPFSHAGRTYPVYFPYPYVYADDIRIELPPGLTAEDLPAPKTIANALADFSLSYAVEGGTLRVKRQYRLKGVFVDVKGYPAVRSLYAQMQQADDGRAVLRATAPEVK